MPLNSYKQPESLIAIKKPWPDSRFRDAVERNFTGPGVAGWGLFDEDDRQYESWLGDHMERKDADTVVEVTWSPPSQELDYAIDDYGRVSPRVIDAKLRYSPDDVEMERVLERFWAQRHSAWLPSRLGLEDNLEDIGIPRARVDVLATEEAMEVAQERKRGAVGPRRGAIIYNGAAAVASDLYTNYRVLPPSDE